MNHKNRKNPIFQNKEKYKKNSSNINKNLSQPLQPWFQLQKTLGINRFNIYLNSKRSFYTGAIN
jgi:hypothetical protein